MRKIIIILISIFIASQAMAGSTTYYGWDYGTRGQQPWWDVWVSMFQSIDLTVKRVSQPLEYDNGTTGVSLTISAANGPAQKLTLGGNTAISFTQPTTGTMKIILKIIQATGVHYNPSWVSVSWMTTGVAPTVYQTDGTVDFVGCYLDGTNTYCMASH